MRPISPLGAMYTTKRATSDCVMFTVSARSLEMTSHWACLELYNACFREMGVELWEGEFAVLSRKLWKDGTVPAYFLQRFEPSPLDCVMHRPSQRKWPYPQASRERAICISFIYPFWCWDESFNLNTSVFMSILDAWCDTNACTKK